MALNFSSHWRSCAVLWVVKPSGGSAALDCGPCAFSCKVCENNDPKIRKNPTRRRIQPPESESRRLHQDLIVRESLSLLGLHACVGGNRFRCFGSLHYESVVYLPGIALSFAPKRRKARI